MKKITLSKETMRVLTAQETAGVGGGDLYPPPPVLSRQPDFCPISGTGPQCVLPTDRCLTRPVTACITQQPGCAIGP
ncbi:hypothetical protein [Tahibacter soli]|uniref:Uncharacterized protein n=1 Tax=Tahibacter soli TaxID=2983605 RepID=A0A9X3YQ94_9GAMM|nr:hypothetical protein [Tahibacter soli]MDC8015917.1 hypothetical protein [Tahibacter soli]